MKLTGQKKRFRVERAEDFTHSQKRPWAKREALAPKNKHVSKAVLDNDTDLISLRFCPTGGIGYVLTQVVMCPSEELWRPGLSKYAQS